MAKAGRKPKAATEIKSEAQPFNEAEAEKVSAALTELTLVQQKHQIMLRNTIGDVADLPVDALWHEAKFFARAAGESVLQLGLRLVALKEKMERDEFLERVDQLGLAPRTARKYMQAALKFDGHAAAPALASLGTTKMLELVATDDDEIEALAEGGTVAGLTLDEIDKMSTRELRAALKEKSGQNEALEQMLAERNQERDELQKKLLRTPDVRAFDDRARAIAAKANDAAVTIEEQITALDQLARQGVEPRDDEAEPTADEMLSLSETFGQTADRIDKCIGALASALNHLYFEPYGRRKLQ